MTKVVIANRWTDPAGKVYKGGQAVEVEPGVARDLIARGKARLPESTTKSESPKPATAGKEAKKDG